MEGFLSMIIELTDGTTVDSAELSLDRKSYHVFFAGTEDVTDLMRQYDKVRTFSNFDRDRDNNRASDENRIAHGQAPVVVGSTSLWGNFATQIVTDPFSAPLEAADRLGNKISANTLFSQIKWLLIIATVIYLFVTLGGHNVLKAVAKK
jgi:hypothetical protein